MAKKKTKKKSKSGFEMLALKEPNFTVLSDKPLDADEDLAVENFDLDYRLGPVFDIIRNEDTKPPLAVAIYGSWGTGKTTAMRWLDGLLEKWNTSRESEGHITTRNVWFYPWKYYNRQDVWRGLISEVILQAIDIKNADVKTVTKAAKQFGMFLGRSFLRVLEKIDIKAKVGDEKAGVGIEGGLSLGAVSQIVDEYQRNVHPEKQFLNEFETTLEEWVKDTLGENKRMVIFVDDLDRCLPNVALEVLEALKLYLNIDRLIFVVGVDKEVVNKVVMEHYKKYNLDESKSGNYLSKMFQVEVSLAPSEKRIEEYVSDQLGKVHYKSKLEIKSDQGGPLFFDLFKGLIFSLAGRRNPREVKRLINSSLMAGAGAQVLSITRPESKLTFEQGAQIFFVRRILEKPKYDMAHIVGSASGDDFFTQWSQIVRTNPNISKTIKQPAEYYKEQPKRMVEAMTKPESLADMDVERMGSERGAKQRQQEDITDAFRKFAAEKDEFKQYEQLVNNPKFTEYLVLLGDDELGGLMAIEYSPDIAGISETTQKGLDLSKLSADGQKILEQIAETLGKDVQDITEQDLSELEEIDLSGLGISDIRLLEKCTNLQSLELGGTQISDLEPIKGLSKLEILSLNKTQVSDLEPIKELGILKGLNLSRTQVSDLEAIKGFGSLEVLGLNGTKVSSLESIKGLSSLRWLYLTNTQVSGLEAIKGLGSLQGLYLSKSKVSGLEAIKGLGSLKELRLNDTSVGDLEPIKGLSSLQELSFSNTRVSDLEPIKELSSLQKLFLTNTSVSNFEPIKGLGSLEALGLSRTQVKDLEVIKGLSSLQRLWLGNTQVSDLEAIRWLSSLKELYLSKTQVSDLKPIKELSGLKELWLKGTQVSDEQVKELQMALPKLEIVR